MEQAHIELSPEDVSVLREKVIRHKRRATNGWWLRYLGGPLDGLFSPDGGETGRFGWGHLTDRGLVMVLYTRRGDELVDPETRTVGWSP